MTSLDQNNSETPKISKKLLAKKATFPPPLSSPPAPHQDDLAGVSLSPPLVAAWRRALFHHARVGRNLGLTEGQRQSDSTLEGKTPTSKQIFQAVLKAEKGEVERLWSVFNQERSELSRHLLTTKKAAVGYLLGFHLVNAARATMTLKRALARHPGLSQVHSFDHIQWLDMGAGTGAVAQAIGFWLGAQNIQRAEKVQDRRKKDRLTLILSDQGRHLLDLAASVLKESGLDESVRILRRSLDQGYEHPIVQGGQDKTLYGYSLSYVWNELEQNPKAKHEIMRILEAPLGKNLNALVMVLEPATQGTSRSAMLLRDELVSKGYRPLYPCPEAGRCPLNQRSRDWCYSEAIWSQSPEMEHLDRTLGLDRSRLSAASYLFASPTLWKTIENAEKNIELQSDKGVVVGRPRHLNGQGFDYLVCQGEGLGLKKIARNFGQSDRTVLRGLRP